MIRREEGFSLVSVMVAFVLLMAIGLGMLSLVMSGLRGTMLFEQAMQALHVAEAGVNYGVAQLVTQASTRAGSDEAYAGEPDEIALAGGDDAAQGTFRVTVFCLYPAQARPPGCADDPSTAADERDFRRIVSLGVVPRRTGVAQRRLEATVRRYTLDIDLPGICGREGVELGQGTWVIADVGSNGTVRLDGSAPPPGLVRARSPRAPSVPPAVEAAGATGQSGLSGSYTWRVTFVDASGIESAGSPPSLTLRLVDEHARVTNIPTGGSEIVRRRIYRTRGDAPSGPWFLVGEISDNRTLDYTDAQPDRALIYRLPAYISGDVSAAGTVSCAIRCGLQVEGRIRESVRDVICPNYLSPPAAPGNDAVGETIVQRAVSQTLHLRPLTVGAEGLTIQTLSTPGAELHIHTAAIHLAPGAILAVTGAATVYFHVDGPVVLDEDAVFGASDSSGNLVIAADRIVVLSTARDDTASGPGAASVSLRGNNKMAAVVFAPDAVIEIDGATAMRGALFGRHVRVTNSVGLVFDPNEGLRSVRSVVRPSPFQYVQRWYDDPNPATSE